MKSNTLLNIVKFVLCCFWVVSSLVEASEFEFQYRPDNGPSLITFKGEYRLWTLTGEPVHNISYTWSIHDNEVTLDPNTNNTNSSNDQCAIPYGIVDVPWEVLQQVTIVDVDFRAMLLNSRYEENWYDFIDGGAAAKPGLRGQQGKSNFNTPGSPSWDELLYVRGNKTEAVSEETAKLYVKWWLEAEEPEADIDIADIEFNLSPVHQWLNAQKAECEKEKKQEKKQQQKNSQLSDFEKAFDQQVSANSSNHADFERLLDTVSNEKVASQSNSSTESITLEGSDFESKLNNVNAYHEKRENAKLAAIAKRSNEFKIEANENKQLGYTLDGEFVIAAQYNEANAFKDGVALVCNYERLANGRFNNIYLYIDSRGNPVGKTVVEPNTQYKCVGGSSSPVMPLVLSTEGSYPHRTVSYTFSCKACGNSHSYTGTKQYFYEYEYDIYGSQVSKKEIEIKDGSCPLILCSR